MIALGCAKNERASGPVFTVRLLGDPPTLDPAHTTDTVGGGIVRQIFDGLVDLDPVTLEVRPAVAASWVEEEGGQSYVFTLRDDVRFHDGQAVTAADVRASFERVLAPATASERPWSLLDLEGAEEFHRGAASSVRGIEVLDDRRIRLRLSRPSALFLPFLAMEAASIVPSSAGSDGRFGTAPVGCGPFRLTAWRHDIEVRLERFDGYYGGAPAIASLRFRVVPDRTAALEEYRRGTMDLLDQLPPGRLESLRRERPQEVFEWPILAMTYFGMNQGKPPFEGRPALRRAFNHAIDREAICRVVLEGAAEPIPGVLPPALRWGTRAPEGYAYDPALSRALLAEAGFPGGGGLEEIVLWHRADGLVQRVCEVVQANLGEVGVRVRLRSADWAAYLDATNRGESAFFHATWYADYPDPDNFLYVLLNSAMRGAAGNDSYYANPRFDALVEEARRIADREQRARLYAEAESLAVAEAPWIFGYAMRDVALVAPRWDGIGLPAVGDWAIDFSGVRQRKP